MINVMYLDDNLILRDDAETSVKNYLKGKVTLRTFGTIPSLDEALKTSTPDFLVLDNILSGERENGNTRGIELVSKYKALYPSINIVIYSSHVSSSDKDRAFSDGAIAVKSKSELEFHEMLKLVFFETNYSC